MADEEHVIVTHVQAARLAIKHQAEAWSAAQRETERRRGQRLPHGRGRAVERRAAAWPRVGDEEHDVVRLGINQDRAGDLAVQAEARL